VTVTGQAVANTEAGDLGRLLGEVCVDQQAEVTGRERCQEQAVGQQGQVGAREGDLAGGGGQQERRVGGDRLGEGAAGGVAGLGGRHEGADVSVDDADPGAETAQAVGES
jgi:hypothetical protein